MDDKRWDIPTKYRASLDINDEQAHALLVVADAEQKKLSQRINSPFTRTSPRESARSKALIAIRTLLEVKNHQKLAPMQIEQLAEAYAQLGRYDLATETTKNKEQKKWWKIVWAAIWKDDDDKCPHPDTKKYVKDRIWSLKHSKEKSLIVCQVCGHVNVTSTPLHLATQFQARNQHIGKAKHATIADALAWHQDHVRKG